MTEYAVEYAGREALVSGMDAKAVRLALMVNDDEYVQFFRVLISGPELLAHHLGTMNERWWRAFALAGGRVVEAAVRSGISPSAQPIDAKVYTVSFHDLEAALPRADEVLEFDPEHEGFGTRPVVHTFSI